MAIYKFPENFKWGSATSAHQIEGDNHNDWTEWELGRAKKEAEEARTNPPAGGWPQYILDSYPNPLQEENYISGKACDSYNRYEEDFDIVKNLNQNIHRFSIEWSRIEPEEGRFNEKEMQHYVNLVKSLRDRGIEPMVTLWHFTNPVWFAKKGGFINLNSPECFRRYVKYVAENLKDVNLWITFNEATTVYSGFSYLMALWPPQHKSIFEWRRVNKNIVLAHILAYKQIKNTKEIHVHSPVDINKDNSEPVQISENPTGDTSHNAVPRSDSFYESGTGVMVGVAESIAYVPYGKSLYHKIVGKIYNYYRNFYFWANASPYYDFIGLNYYQTDRKFPGSQDVLPKQETTPDMGWEIYPEGLYRLLMEFKKYKKPVYITENGIADTRDRDRDQFIKNHLLWIWKAIRDGADVRGYLYWSLLDNLELHRGFMYRFGLVEINYKTLERHIRPSALEYAKICKENTLIL